MGALSHSRLPHRKNVQQGNGITLQESDDEAEEAEEDGEGGEGGEFDSIILSSSVVEVLQEIDGQDVQDASSAHAL